jgi:hypothetical protein
VVTGFDEASIFCATLKKNFSLFEEDWIKGSLNIKKKKLNQDDVL